MRTQTHTHDDGHVDKDRMLAQESGKSWLNESDTKSGYTTQSAWVFVRIIIFFSCKTYAYEIRHTTHTQHPHMQQVIILSCK